MPVLKLEPFSGLSGDMFVAAAAGVAGGEEEVSALPARLGLSGVRAEFFPVFRAGIACRGFRVIEAETRDHHHHHHRNAEEILGLIRAADLPGAVLSRAERILRSLAAAEAVAHGVAPEEVRFHEVGEADSILDITAAALLIERLRPEKVYCAPVRTGRGFVKTAHGLLPVPAPAAAELLRGMPVWAGEEEGEFTTPTGAAILRELAPEFSDPVIRVTASSWGAGEREYPHPNALRLSLGEVFSAAAEGEMALLQANLDDFPPEFLGADLIEEILSQGAVDAFISPLVMKKGRPGHKLEVLAPAALADELAAFLLESTSTLGVRKFPVTRRCLSRLPGGVETPYGRVGVKIASAPSGEARFLPEYEDCLRLGREKGIPAYRVYLAALKAKPE